MKREEWIGYLPVYFIHVGSVSLFTVLYGLLRVLNVGEVGAVTICGVTVLAWRPSPEYDNA